MHSKLCVEELSAHSSAFFRKLIQRSPAPPRPANAALRLSCRAQVEKCKAAAAKKLTQPSNGNKVAGGTQRVEGYNVAYVGNIAYDATREDLMAMFK